MKNEEVTLTRECPATVIPAGDMVNLPRGGKYQIAQALGGSVTLRDATAMYRVAPEDLDALGEELHARIVVETAQQEDGEAKAFGEDRIWDALRGCFDPEIPINVVDLGLIYDLKLDQTEGNGHEVSVKMTLTAQGCGMGPVIAQDAQERIQAIPEVEKAEVKIVWDPPWSPRMISEEGKQILGLT